jgi:hypothetical protein
MADNAKARACDAIKLAAVQVRSEPGSHSPGPDTFEARDVHTPHLLAELAADEADEEGPADYQVPHAGGGAKPCCVNLDDDLVGSGLGCREVTQFEDIGRRSGPARFPSSAPPPYAKPPGRMSAADAAKISGGRL